MQIFFTIFMLFVSLILKLLGFTGLYIPIITLILLRFIESKLNIQVVAGNTMDQIEVVVMLLSIVPIPFITLQSIIRLGKPDFSLIESVHSLIERRNRAKVNKPHETYENVAKELIGLESGVVLGKMNRNYLVMEEKSEGHIMVVGGQGSGKSSSIAIPTLLNYNSSIFAIDIKGELSESSKSYRWNMKVFDPLSEETPHYNPYAVFKKGDKVQGAREIVNSIIPIGANEKDPYWKQSAQNLLTASILHYENEYKDFPTTCKIIMETPVNELIEILRNSPVNEVKLFVNQFVGADSKLLASIYSTLANEIILFATDKDIMRALSANGNMISPRDLESYTDIFIKISEDKLEQWKSLLNLMVSQFLKSFEKREDKGDKKILFMIDEFARLGKVESITNGLATLRSKGVQIMLILQSLAQLDMIYGKDNRKVITDNCNYKIVLNASDVDTQEYFSKLVGTVEKIKKSSSVSRNDFSVKANKGTSKTTEEKKIIKPEEFAYLEKPVVFTPKGFFRPNKVKWYEDKVFIERAKGVSHE